MKCYAAGRTESISDWRISGDLVGNARGMTVTGVIIMVA